MDGGPPGHALVAVTTRPWLEAQPVVCLVSSCSGKGGHLWVIRVWGGNALPAGGTSRGMWGLQEVKGC